jgi:hypothetical protein
MTPSSSPKCARCGHREIRHTEFVVGRSALGVPVGVCIACGIRRGTIQPHETDERWVPKGCAAFVAPAPGGGDE